MAANLPPDSATRRSRDPHWQRTAELDLLRDIEHTLRVLAWQQTKDGSRGVGYPEPVPLPWDQEEDGVFKGDRMTFDEADEWLGWDKMKQKGA